jgi:hypothetical protein
LLWCSCHTRDCDFVARQTALCGLTQSATRMARPSWARNFQGTAVDEVVGAEVGDEDGTVVVGAGNSSDDGVEVGEYSAPEIGSGACGGARRGTAVGEEVIAEVGDEDGSAVVGAGNSSDDGVEVGRVLRAGY